MSKDTFKVKDLEYGTLDTPDPDDALERSHVEKDNCCDDGDDFDNKCLISAITDEILFGS